MLEVKVENCAGIDVGKKFLAVCVLTGPVDRKPAKEVRRFGTSVRELERLRAWLMEKKCTEAVMESTGSYWKPVFNILEGSLKIILANPEQVKALRGKKTDPKDSGWLASLLRHGLVQGSFIPPRDIRELRDLTRRRRTLVGDGAAERNRVQKVLEDANVKIGNVLSNVCGTSGQAMLEALLENKRTAAEIAELGHWSLAPKIPQIVEALEGHRMTEHHRFMIRQSLRHMRKYRRDDRRIGERNRHAIATLSAANPIGVFGAGNQADRRRYHLSGDGNGHESRRAISRLSPSGILGDGLSR
jgi:transposase